MEWVRKCYVVLWVSQSVVEDRGGFEFYRNYD